MHNGVKHLCVFILGAAVGSVASWVVLKNKFEQIAREEIESVIDEFSSMRDVAVKNLEKDDTPEPSIHDEYETIAGKYTTKKGGSENMYNGPRVISPKEFQENENYDTVSLNYYADNVLADDMDELVEDIEETVGSDFAECFGEYEPDTVYVVNDRLKCYYEICADDRYYHDVASDDPNLMDG